MASLVPQSQSSDEEDVDEGPGGVTALMATICSCLLELVTVLAFIVLAPVALVVLGLLLLLPVVDWALHPRRDYLDGISSCLFRNSKQSIIHAIITSPTPIAAEEIQAHFRATYLSTGRPEARRWHQRVVDRCWLWSYWEDHPEFDEAEHIRTEPAPVTQEGLEHILAGLAATPLEMHRPPWELRIFPTFQEGGQPGSAVVIRVHHSMGDGFEAMRVMLRGCSLPEGCKAPKQRMRRPSASLWQSLSQFPKATRKAIFSPGDQQSALFAAKKILPTGDRAMSWRTLKTASVDDLKSLGKSLDGASVNDLLLTAFSGAVGKYIKEKEEAAHGGPSLPERVTSAMWVSQASIQELYQDSGDVPICWGNEKLSFVHLPLPISPERQQGRDLLQDVRMSTSRPELMAEAVVGGFLLKLTGLLPRPIAAIIWLVAANKVSMSVSTIPGPPFPVSWLGMPVRRLVFFVPTTESTSLFANIMTFNGEVTVGLCGNASLVDQESLQRICGEYFHQEIQALRMKASMEA